MGQSPEMHVDIGNFRYLAATGDEAEGQAVAVTVSQGAQTIYVHVVHVGDTGGRDMGHPVDPRAAGYRARRRPPSEVCRRRGHRATCRVRGRAARRPELSHRRIGALGHAYPSLVALAAFLAEDPARRVVLVGHTDAEGGRDSNIALSEARAAAVRRHLIDVLGVNPAQLDAAGIGYLAPRATNETAGGREANRRVEVVLLDGG
jgi:OOP family OmpA-OmpF porin